MNIEKKMKMVSNSENVKLFFDTEFTGLHQKTTLISIGIISEKGDKIFHAEFNDYDNTQINDWLKNNVLAKLVISKRKGQPLVNVIKTADKEITEVYGNKNQIKKELIKWLKSFNNTVEFWSDCLSYDWVLFCNLFGNAFSVPKDVYYIPFDICTLFKLKNIDPDINREIFAEMPLLKNNTHNALTDAIIIRACYEKLLRI